MRLLVRVVAIGLVILLGLIFLGPMAPTDSFVAEWSSAIRQALNAWWGFPFGLPTN